MRKLLTTMTGILLLVTACSSDSSLTEYAEQLESLVNTMNQRLDSLDERLGAEPTLEEMRTYAAERIAARTGFLDDFRKLGAHEDVADLYAAALGIIERLTVAESGLLDYVMEAETAEEAAGVWDSPVGVAAREVDQESLVLCAAAQSLLDATEDRDEFTDVPWIPPEMKEVISVAFRCDASQR